MSTMSSAQKIAALILVILGLWAGNAMAQIPVTDVGNLAVNTESAIFNTIAAIQNVLQTAYMINEIVSIAELAVNAAEFFDDLAELTELVGEIGEVAQDLHSITQQVTTLFGLGSAPVSASGLAKRQAEIRRALMEVQVTAIRVQTLIRTVVHTVAHIKNIVNRIAGFVGNMQANQNINESLASLQKLEAMQNATTTAFQRAMTMQAMEGPLVQESLREINRQFCGKWCE